MTIIPYFKKKRVKDTEKLYSGEGYRNYMKSVLFQQVKGNNEVQTSVKRLKSFEKDLTRGNIRTGG